MITETIYKCEVCGQIWGTPELAAKCEASHIFAENIFHQGFPKSEKYPQTIIMAMGNGQNIQYKYDRPIIEMPSGLPYVKSIHVSREVSENRIVLIAHGDNLPIETYTWVLWLDDERRVATSNEPQITLSKALSDLFDASYTVRVKVSAPDIEATQFVVKDVS